MGRSGSHNHAIARHLRKYRRAAAWWACVAWIASGVYLFAATPGASFLSGKSLLFFLVGTFAASVVLSLATYIVERLVAWPLIKLIRSPGPTAVAFVTTFAQILLIAEALLAFFGARVAFNTMA